MELDLIIILAVIAGAVVFLRLFRTGPARETPQPARETPSIVGAIGELQLVKVRHVIDGDTVIVATSWSEYKVRLDSIDCPELGQNWGNISKAGLIKLIGGRHVCLEIHGADIYGRKLGTVYVRHSNASEWINVNERMVMLGHAWVWRDNYQHLSRPRQVQLNRLERWAKSKRVGLWNSNSPEPPWRWRRQNQQA